ncbi:hypothetical protein [Methylobacterium gnaphalii]|uniref:Uncharacterized protein n=1 Tax=Methylobacterium gnaphalii TaxID=1010610 RepID=A0A512JJH8_9HYPH|nr:hypothetical protein [Methylobacterium gnaphalii]GEP10106.1 hypothetical protein MGN01_19510 [Methylobacterium gnaphalii]GLS48376.1 hypothetical protein GCM10007885_12200 [Methylobacterium gnaphalii]
MVSLKNRALAIKGAGLRRSGRAMVADNMMGNRERRRLGPAAKQQLKPPIVEERGPEAILNFSLEQI